MISDPSIPHVKKEKVICEHHNTTLTCPEGKVLKIMNADYGRQGGETCSAGHPAHELGNHDCQTCVARKVREW